MSLSKKQKVAALSIASNITLIILKVIAGIMSGSVSIISEAIHSGMDLLASFIAYISVSISGKPADDSHPYGHGKIENISGVVEGVLIFIAAGLIIKEAVERILHPVPIDDTVLGMGVMLFSAVLNSFVAYRLYKIAKEEDSVALEADALHLKTDVYTSLGVAVGLLAIRLTGIQVLDPLIAILVALLIIKEAWHLCIVAFSPLLDSRLDKDEESPIQEVLENYGRDKSLQIKYFKTRKAGNQRFIDFHLCLSPDTTIKEGNELAREIKEKIYEVYADAHIHINLEVMDRGGGTSA
ncbi:MAG: cation diffusion facilitator family transporter [Bacillota bacterium]